MLFDGVKQKLRGKYFICFQEPQRIWTGHQLQGLRWCIIDAVPEMAVNDAVGISRGISKSSSESISKSIRISLSVSESVQLIETRVRE